MNEQLIKFRGISVKTGKMVYGYLFEHIWEKGHLSYIIKSQSVPALTMPTSEFIEIKPETRGQFVGVLRSKQEVYIGDIAQHGASIRIVEFRNGNTMLIRPDKSGTILLSFSEGAKILGNIHQHPHLIK